jgi:hypothetical protein
LNGFKKNWLIALNELYGFTGFLIDANNGLYKSIDIHQMSTFNQEKMWVKEWE